MCKWLWLSLVVVVLDQATKLAASAYLAVQAAPLEVLPYFNLFLVHNAGAAFSLLAMAGGWQRWFFIVVTILVVWFLTVWLGKLPAEQKLSAVGIALVIGGAVGNFIDRLFLGYVVDFIDLHYQNYHWPTFNIADSAITIGVLLLIGLAVFYKEA